MTDSMRCLTLIMLALVLAGCGVFNRDRSDADRPAALVDFDSSLQVERLWSTSAGAGSNRSRPALRPFVDGEEVWVGDHRGRIVSVNAANGRILQRFDTRLDLSAGPAVFDNLLLVGTFDGKLVALDRASGSERWRAPLSSEVLSYPVLHDGVIVVRCLDGRTFGIDPADGRRLWVHDRSVPLLTLRGNSDPLTRAGQVFIGYDNGTVAGLRVNDGSILWEQRVSVPEGRTELERLADIDGPMAIVGTDLYVVTYRGRMASMAIESGRILWVKDVSSHSGISLLRTQIALVDRDDTVWMVDRRNGSTLWREERLARRGLTRPVFVDDYLVTVDSEGFMHWLDAGTGDFVARVRPTRNAPVSAPVVVGNVVYLLDEDGSLSAWRPRG
ncbi:MAG: outer membrane protein assembly factor BamB [Wenzhouxiangella sp.]|nr:outer membrane protein assembly factor BamB [Wenzhouxiangella sp.]